jgi:hypothetical protein
LEAYFKGEISVDELEKRAAELREYGWRKMQAAEISFIPSNDFSFYDNLLDTAFIFNIIPQKYKKLGLSDLDTYFAAAHGYQGEKGDVKALPMKKWFNTNYHYIVPELDDDSEMGFDIILAGEYKKLQMTLSDRNRKSTKSVTVGKVDKDFSSLGTVGRYSEKVVRNLKNYGLRETVAKVKVHLSPNYFNLNKKYEKCIKNVSPSAAELSEQRKLQKNFSWV